MYRIGPMSTHSTYLSIVSWRTGHGGILELNCRSCINIYLILFQPPPIFLPVPTSSVSQKKGPLSDPQHRPICRHTSHPSPLPRPILIPHLYILSASTYMGKFLHLSIYQIQSINQSIISQPNKSAPSKPSARNPVRESPCLTRVF